MAPLPKRKHSTQRKGKRITSKMMDLTKLVVCANCGASKIAHRPCKACGK